MLISSLGFSQIKVVTNGNVGIGNGSPLGGIHAINNNSGEHFRFWANTGFSNGLHLISEYYKQAPGFGNAGMSLGYVANGTDVDYSYLYAPGARDFALATFQAGLGFQPRIYIENTGRVGIGTSTPMAKLDVAGAAFKSAGGDLWNVFSDKRLKNQIKEYEKGLAEVLSMNPVTWYYNGKAGTNTEELNVGLIAQEYQKIEPEFVTEYTFQEESTIPGSQEIDNLEGTHVLKGKKETYLSVNNTPIRYMLINAIQEQQSMIEDMQAQLVELQKQISGINSSTSSNEINVTLEGVYNAELAQNVPNPFGTNTSIEYSIPNNVTADSEILIYNINGQLMKRVSIDHVGAGKLNVNTLELESGNYTYSLSIDGRIIDTKKMIVTK